MTSHDDVPIHSATPAGRSVRIIFPIGMLGGGITEETVSRGISLGADAIAKAGAVVILEWLDEKPKTIGDVGCAVETAEEHPTDA